jgi:hypothetical protein
MYQDLSPHLPDTRNLTPETYKRLHCCPAWAFCPSAALERVPSLLPLKYGNMHAKLHSIYWLQLINH